MNSSDSQEESLFDAARNLNDPAQHKAFLDAACANDPQMRRRLDDLLAAQTGAEKFFEQGATGIGLVAVPRENAANLSARSAAQNPAALCRDAATPNPVAPSGGPVSPDAPTAVSPAADEALSAVSAQAGVHAPIEGPGTIIGRYRLLEQIGEGGFGVVYVAEQREPVKRRVALKIIKLGMDTKQVVARFEAERQALALMDHPNIAKVFDAGTVDAPLPPSGRPLPSSDEGRGQGEGRHSRITHYGRPYFVMELVRGIRITEYCDQNHLPTVERLRLFIQVCHAIQHAHQKGIIHRDIKPSNILVTLHDGVPVPKVIDFGIAKATQQELTEKTVYTQLQQFIGTPAYMSPEQAEMSGLDIDTRSDIYSLGVLLYELLIGKTPFDAQELLKAGLDEMRKTIREREPLRPSTRLNNLLGEEMTTTAKRRGADPPKLVKLLRGDLDWIVMKAIEKDRTRRYDTANGLAMDIQRHLNHEPVLAVAPSALYKFQKFAGRHKATFAFSAAILLLLIASVAVSTWSAIRAKQAEKRARIEAEKNRLSSEIVGGTFLELARGVFLGGSGETLRRMIDIAIGRLEEGTLQSQPEAEAYVRSIMGSAYLQLNESGKAETMQREALAIRKRLLGDWHPDVATSLGLLAEALLQRGDLAGAEAKYREALAIDRKLHANNPARFVSLADVSQRQGKHTEAEKLFSEALNGASESQRAGLLRSRGLFRARHGRWKEASADLAQAAQADPGELSNWMQLAPLLVQTGDLPGYEKQCRTMLARFGETSSPLIARRTAKACLVASISGDGLDIAGRLAETAVKAGVVDASSAWSPLVKGLAEYRQGRFSAVPGWMQGALSKLGRDLIPDDLTRHAQAHMVLAMALQQLKRPDEARATLAKGVEIVQTKLPKLDGGDIGTIWHDVLIAHILMREAKALIEGQPAAPE